ncbi:MAG: DUF11 domain-containing protein, partial [Deltaproteobacteria bacterium]|nr:DUF11 domain-containing protein [Deltaproteobacteria bacterium]
MMWRVLLVGTLVGVLPPAAWAFVVGRAPTLLSSHSIFGNARGVGASLMLPDIQSPQSRSILLTSASASLAGLPPDAIIERAFLFWTGALAETGVSGPKTADTQVSFTVVDGTTFSVAASPGACATVANPNNSAFPHFYYCRAEVTGQVAAHAFAGSYNGVYRVGDVAASPAVFVNHPPPVGRRCKTSFCQAKYAAWSMVVIYSSASETTQRDIRLYDGFLMLDHIDGSMGSTAQTTFTISDFLADADPKASLTFFAVEGDDRLGVPPQSLVPPSDPSYCTTCQDSLAFNGSFVQDTAGRPGNLFNESLESGGNSGVDIDTIDVSSLVMPHATSATIRLVSGTGPVQNPVPSHGGGELFGYGWTLLALSRPAPNFKTSATTKTVNPTSAGHGETLSYTVTVTNTGSAVATHTRVTDTLPAGTTYTPNSLQVGGLPCTDAADGDACFVSGQTITIDLGALSYLPPANSRQIGFLARVASSASNGQTLCNIAHVDSDQTPDPYPIPKACFTVRSPQLAPPTKTFQDLDGGVLEPEDIIQYTLRVRKSSSGQASAIRLTDDMPAHLQLLTVIPPGGSTDHSTTSGGAHGTGRVLVDDITIPAGLDFVTVTILAQVDSEAEFVAGGIPSNAIDGHRICNQGEVTAPFLVGSLKTDDPTISGTEQPTCFALFYRPNLSTSTKQVLDVNGGLLEPLDVLRYTIRLANTGNRSATISLVDDLPPSVTSFSLLSTTPGAVFSPPPGGAHQTGRLDVTSLPIAAHSTREIVFQVKVAAAAADATAIQNCVAFTVAERPSENGRRCSQILHVFARPDLSQSDKRVVDDNGGDLYPGDTITYTLSVHNSGNRPATTALLHDRVATSLTAVTPLDGGAYNASTRIVTWTLGSLAPGATATRRFQAKV